MLYYIYIYILFYNYIIILYILLYLLYYIFYIIFYSTKYYYSILLNVKISHYMTSKNSLSDQYNNVTLISC